MDESRKLIIRKAAKSDVPAVEEVEEEDVPDGAVIDPETGLPCSYVPGISYDKKSGETASFNPGNDLSSCL